MTERGDHQQRRSLRLRLDGSVRRIGDGAAVLGGSPLVLLRLTDAGRRTLERIAAGSPVPVTALVERLVDIGAAHPQLGPADTFTVDDVTTVVPTLDTIPAPSALRGKVIVVDDGSTEPLHLGGLPVLRRAVPAGPGAARNLGLGAVATALVAFVDADVTVDDPGSSTSTSASASASASAATPWFAPLLAHFDDPAVALVAPRVASTPGASVLARYERSRSPLDLGSQPARVRAGTRVSYVPTAAVVARADAVRAIGGFAEALRFGEDVDLVWRLEEAGWRVRYEPAVVVHHAPRPRVRSWAAQRFAYGRSAAPLAQRHPGALAPVRISGWSAAAWGAALLGPPVAGPVAAGAITATATGLLARKLRDLPLAESARLAGLGTVLAGRQLASGLTRAWWPLTLAAAVGSRRMRRAALAAVVVPAALDWWRSYREPDRRLPALDPVRFCALRLADDLAYGAGLWAGAVGHRTLAPLAPDLTSWPRPPRKLGSATSAVAAAVHH